MTIKVLGQGLEADSADSVGKYLIDFLANRSFNSFHAITAFTSLAGINGLRQHIENAMHLERVNIITGVDQKGTSLEALTALLELNVNSYVFFVPPPSPIFHPKIYLFEGLQQSELIIGSSNLTASGLFTNVEASVLISMNNQIAADRKIVESLKQYFGGLFNCSDPNLQPLTTDLIADLLNADILPTEIERRQFQEKKKKDCG